MAVELFEGFDTVTIGQLSRRYPLWGYSGGNYGMSGGYGSVGQSLHFSGWYLGETLTIPITARSEYFVGFHYIAQYYHIFQFPQWQFIYNSININSWWIRIYKLIGRIVAFFYVCVGHLDANLNSFGCQCYSRRVRSAM